jgi:hypothetical protein
MSFSIIKPKKFDGELFKKIWKITFPQLDANKRIEWSYDTKIFPNPDVFYIRENKESVVIGSCTVFFREFKYKDRILTIGITGDFSIIPQYRSLLPAILLQKRIIEDNKEKKLDLLIAFPNKISYPVQKRAGFIDSGKMMRYVQIIKTKGKLKNIFPYNAPDVVYTVIDSFLHIYYELISISIKKKNDYKLDGQFPNENEISKKFIEQSKKKFNLINDISYEYLKWRFLENPLQNYKFFRVRTPKNELVAFIVYSVDKKNTFVEFFLWNDKFILLESLFIKFKRYLNNSRYETISVIINSKSYITDKLRKIGFMKTGMGTNILIYKISNCFNDTSFDLSKNLIFNSDNDL